MPLGDMQSIFQGDGFMAVTINCDMGEAFGLYHMGNDENGYRTMTRSSSWPRCMRCASSP